MPAKNSRKQFVSDAYYHLYNRGVEKRPIFQDSQDYNVFLSYLTQYLLPKDINALHNTLSDSNISWNLKDKVLKLLRLNNFSENIFVIAYVLMPNHFHFLIQQKESNSIDRFMNSLCTRYSMYFNRKYNRVGRLFQNVYRAVLVETDEQLLHLSRYIHRNPLPLTPKAPQGQALRSYRYSSYAAYIGKEKTSWVKPEIILASFVTSGFNSYRSFVEKNSIEMGSIEKISQIVLD